MISVQNYQVSVQLELELCVSQNLFFKVLSQPCDYKVHKCSFSNGRMSLRSGAGHQAGYCYSSEAEFRLLVLPSSSVLFCIH